SSESSIFSELSWLVAWLEVFLATPVVLDDLCSPPDNSTFMSATLPSGSTSIGSD
ncbi:1479_t:CDS:1, partial [Funneliformis caledonium]